MTDIIPNNIKKNNWLSGILRIIIIVKSFQIIVPSASARK